MNKNDYKLEKLVNTFKNHHEEYLKQHKKQIDRHKEEYGENYPHEFFSMAQALHVMCKEILDLKEKVKVDNE